MLVWTDPAAPLSLAEEEGWFAWEYGSRRPRKAFRYRHQETAPAAFLTLLVPYRGTAVPTASAKLAEDYTVGANRVELTVEAFGRRWQIGRDLSGEEAWCELSGERQGQP